MKNLTQSGQRQNSPVTFSKNSGSGDVTEALALKLLYSKVSHAIIKLSESCEIEGTFEKLRVRDHQRSKEGKVEQGRVVIKPKVVNLGENGHKCVKGM